MCRSPHAGTTVERVTGASCGGEQPIDRRGAQAQQFLATHFVEAKVKSANAVRSSWHHVIDVAPTVLEAAHLPKPWDTKPRRPLFEDDWELCDTRTDFSPANDLAAKEPSKLKDMQEIFLKEAIANLVFPIDDRSLERVNAELAGRPDLMAGRTTLSLYAGMAGTTENVF